MFRKALVSGATVGVVFAVALATVSGGSSGAPGTTGSLYDRVAAAAAKGDPRAQEQLVAIDAFMQLNGLRVTDLTEPEGKRSQVPWEDSLVQLSLEDFGPWRIDIDNETQFSKAADVSAYRAIRHATLDAMAAHDPGRQIAVAVSPNGARSITEIANALHGKAIGRQLIVDVYAPGGWLMTVGYDLSGRDFVAEADAISAAVLDQAATSLDQFAGITRADLSAAVRIVYLEMSATSAQEASQEPTIYAVDPLTDIADAFRGRAAIVVVGNAPELRVAHARLVLTDPVDAHPVWPGQ